MSLYEWCISKPAQNTMVALAKLTAATLGTSTICNGLAASPTSPASMQIQIGAGEIYQLANLESTLCGTLPQDTTHQIVKQGVLLDAFTTANGALAAPGTSGQSINYLIEAQYADSDVSIDPTTGNTPVVLQFYDASNPTSPWSGPNNSGQTSNTFRKGVVSLQVKAGTAATTGSQVTPTPDSGWVGLWVVTVANGQSTITAGNITAYNGAPVLSAPLLTQVQQSPSVVGNMRNLVMSVATASATATLTADEIVVESALGGNAYKLANFNKSINLATTGAGGMDTGSAPVSGFVALYAIYNPTTQTSALLATNSTSIVAPNVYGGGNMPSGYTASALVSVWPTNSSSQLKAGYQADRRITYAAGNAISTTATGNISVTALSIAGLVPKNAKTITAGGSHTASSGTNGAIVISLYPDSAGNGGSSVGAYAPISNGGTYGNFSEIVLGSSQTIYYGITISGVTGYSYIISINGYTF